MTVAASPQVTRIGDLSPADRERVEEIVAGTGQFSEAEIEVALEVFDAGIGLGVGLGEMLGQGLGELLGKGEQPLDPDYKFVGAFDGSGTLLGYACYGPTPQTDRAWDLYWIVVAKETHGRGVGSRILAEVERRLIAERARILLIETSARADYEATRTFYASRGYIEEARIADFYAPSDDRVLYTKQLISLNAGI